ncbi:MAG TPA: choice-of-anchor R domain-containing protein, partial [Rhizomicrobium sp.]
MIKQALLSSAALVLASSVAFAGPAHPLKGVTVTKSLHGHPIMGMITNHKASARGHGIGKLASGYGNFSDMPNAPFISWYSYYVYGSSVIGEPFQIAVGFTAPSTGKVSAVDVGLSAYYAGFYGYTGSVAVYDDAGGIPGNNMAKKATPVTAAATSWGPCCYITQAPMKKVKLKAGKQYWIVVQADPSSFMLWSLQDSDFVNP